MFVLSISIAGSENYYQWGQLSKREADNQITGWIGFPAVLVESWMFEHYLGGPADCFYVRSENIKELKLLRFFEKHGLVREVKTDLADPYHVFILTSWGQKYFRREHIKLDIGIKKIKLIATYGRVRQMQVAKIHHSPVTYSRYSYKPMFIARRKLSL